MVSLVYQKEMILQTRINKERIIMKKSRNKLLKFTETSLPTLLFSAMPMAENLP